MVLPIMDCLGLKGLSTISSLLAFYKCHLGCPLSIKKFMNFSSFVILIGFLLIHIQNLLGHHVRVKYFKLENWKS